MDADGSRRVALCALTLLAPFLGCGGRTSSPSAVVDGDASALADAAADAIQADAPADTMQADAPVDAGTFVCGDTQCPLDTITICVYPGCGCLVETEAPLDAGVCPDGSVLSEAGSCVVPPVCGSPSCTQLDPSGAFCSGQGGTLSGGVFPPLSPGSGRTCHVSCL